MTTERAHAEPPEQAPTAPSSRTAGAPAPSSRTDGAPAPSSRTDGAPAPSAEAPWLRVHFISPLVRGWIALVAILYFAGRDWFEGLFDAETRGRSPLPEGVGLLVAVGVLVGVVVLIALVFLVSWYFTRYQVTEDHVRVHSGVVFRQQRQARLDRVQAIDIVQPLLARIFGLAELKFEVADAGESAVRLAFLKIDDAKRLRATILAHAAGVRTDPEHPEEIVEAPEREVVAIPPRRVVGAALLSGTTVALVLLVVVVVTLSIVLETVIIGASLAPVLIGVVGAYWSVLSTGYNFRAATSPDGIRLRYGLLDTRAQTVPPGRVQALSITQSPLWRLKGWYRIKVNVAGYGLSGTNEGQARATLLPVGTLEEVLQIVALVLPDPGTARPVELFAQGLTGRDSAEGFATTPRRARWLAPLAWRRNGFAATDSALLVRSGVLWRQLVVVPHERTQSLSLHQGPLGRRFGVADLQFQTTPGPVTPHVIQADAAVAWELFHAQSARAAEARSRSLPEQWMKPVPVRVPDGATFGHAPGTTGLGFDGPAESTGHTEATPDYAGVAGAGDPGVPGSALSGRTDDVVRADSTVRAPASVPTQAGGARDFRALAGGTADHAGTDDQSGTDASAPASDGASVPAGGPAHVSDDAPASADGPAHVLDEASASADGPAHRVELESAPTEDGSADEPVIAPRTSGTSGAPQQTQVMPEVPRYVPAEPGIGTGDGRDALDGRE